ncbi:MAG TPA: GNAT family N-acetyltransferase [Saprospiraceae bacterium]|nr:GNAT family N-acetyltransferase [Saprospiraceae bacterium]
MKYFLKTDRLVLRDFDIPDASFIVELLNSKGWLEFIGDRKVRTIEDAEAYLVNGPIKSYRENGFGMCLVSLNSDDTPIGACGLLKRDYLDHPDIGFAFLPEHAGKGYGFESASAILRHEKETLEIDHVLAFSVPFNVASIKLLEKLGFHFEKAFKMPGEEEELFLYSNH